MHPLPVVNDEINLRCWYWRGASGRHYIHSVYRPGTCPPFRGGVYVAVKRNGDLRRALAVGSFSDFGTASAGVQILDTRGADEIHVHLLARSPAAIMAVIADVQAAMDAKPQGQVRPLGFPQERRSAA